MVTYQPFDDGDDVAHEMTDARHVVDARDVQAHQALGVIRGDAFGQSRDRGVLFGRLPDQFVIDVGDVHDERNLKAEIAEVALDRVEDDRPDHVPDMAGLVDGWTTQIHADLSRLDGMELLLLPGQRVVDAQTRHNLSWFSEVGGMESRHGRGVLRRRLLDERHHLAGDRFGTADVADPLAVLALTLTALIASPSSPARLARMSALIGPTSAPERR